MEISVNAEQLMTLVALVVIVMAAASRFNSPIPVRREYTGWMDRLRAPFRLHQDTADVLPPPPRAATTAFKYRVHQAAYAGLAVMVFLFAYWVPGVREQLGAIITGLGITDHVPLLADSGPLVLAAFVIVVLPNIPPFRWADTAIRRELYLRADIPGRQLREASRLKHAHYQPPAEVLERVRTLGTADGFDAEDIVYDPDAPTTRSLWTKCATLIHQISLWQGTARYGSAFAVLKTHDHKTRSVEALRDAHLALANDARVCLAMLRNPPELPAEELTECERRFRERCKAHLLDIYLLLSRVSLHAHYSDRDRVQSFRAIGFDIHEGNHSPLPDLNDLIALGILMALILVLPLADGPLGLAGAVMVALIMYSAVLTPVLLAHVCPRMIHNDPSHPIPNVAYPAVSGLVAAMVGAIILSLGGMLIGPTQQCAFSGYERFLNCSYPWSFLHGGLAALLAWRMTTGSYPTQPWELSGPSRMRAWMDIKDALICMLGMIAIFHFATEPALGSVAGTDSHDTFLKALRVGLLGLAMGALVPTWFRGYGLRHRTDRRTDPERRRDYQADLDLFQQQIVHRRE